mmetsp:Transcript_29154/g.92995  ORF Transcript_29154/g.92995 Transcript_29154/m.92995 type:complete len:231 (+) Transcript_29154:3-695(+)
MFELRRREHHAMQELHRRWPAGSGARGARSLASCGAARASDTRSGLALRRAGPAVQEAGDLSHHALRLLSEPHAVLHGILRRVRLPIVPLLVRLQLQVPQLPLVEVCGLDDGLRFCSAPHEARLRLAHPSLQHLQLDLLVLVLLLQPFLLLRCALKVAPHGIVRLLAGLARLLLLCQGCAELLGHLLAVVQAGSLLIQLVLEAELARCISPPLEAPAHPDPGVGHERPLN